MPLEIGFSRSSNYGEYSVVGVIDQNNYVIRFQDGYEKVSQRKEVLSGVVKNPYYPHVAGVGFIGDGKFCAKINRKNTPEYEVWSGLFKRCYNLDRQASLTPTYAGCTISEDWLNFQNFAEWYVSHRNYGKGYALEKDLTVLGNRVYGSQFCDLVPIAVNSLLVDSRKIRGRFPIGVHFCATKKLYIAQCNTGELTSTGTKKQTYLGAFKNPEDAFLAYKVAKEKHIKSVANKYRHEISEAIYINLMNYEVSNANT